MKTSLDKTDRAIVQLLQTDAKISMDDMAKRLDLSKNAVWRRVRHLEASGVLLKRVALVDPTALGLPTMAIVIIKASDHSTAWLEKFNAAVRQLPNILSAYRMTGDIDYMLRIRLESIADYDRFYRRLVDLVNLSDVSASFVMEEIVETTAMGTARADLEVFEAETPGRPGNQTSAAAAE